MATVVTRPPDGVPCVVFALRREAGPFLRLLRRWGSVADSLRESEPTRSASRPPCVLVSGIGAARARKAVESLFADGIRPSVVIAAGFAGALRDGLRVGDVLAATEVIDEAGRPWPTAWPSPTAEVRRFRLFTSSRLIGDPLAKQALGTRHDADAVDMESAAVAEACHRHGVPFGCVRAVSDAVDTALSPKLVSLLAGGRVSPWRLAKALLLAPRLLAEMLRLGRHTRTAARNLASVLLELLRHASPSNVPAHVPDRPAV